MSLRPFVLITIIVHEREREKKRRGGGGEEGEQAVIWLRARDEGNFWSQIQITPHFYAILISPRVIKYPFAPLTRDSTVQPWRILYTFVMASYREWNIRTHPLASRRRKPGKPQKSHEGNVAAMKNRDDFKSRRWWRAPGRKKDQRL